MDPRGRFLLNHLTHLMCCSVPHSWNKLGWTRDGMQSKEIHYNWTTGDLGSRYFSLIPTFLLLGHVYLWVLGATFLNWKEDFKYAKVGVCVWGGGWTKCLPEVLFSPWNLWLLILSHTRVSNHICMHGSVFPSLKGDIFSCCLNYF